MDLNKFYFNYQEKMEFIMNKNINNTNNKDKSK